jgi:hypothetical protein
VALLVAGLTLPTAVEAQTLHVGTQVASIDLEHHNISSNNALALMAFYARR